MKVLIQLCCFIAIIIPVSAVANSAQELLSDCRPIVQADISYERIRFEQTFQTGKCWGTFGVIQRIIVQTDKTGHPIYGICASPNSTHSQLVAIFVSYAEKNPQRLHEEGVDLALESLRAAFPCKSQK